MNSKALSGRTIAIVAAVLIAIGAGFLTWRFVSMADERALEGTELVEVYIAAGNIPQGTTAQQAVSQQLIVLGDTMSEDRPDDAISTVEAISGLVAQGPVLQGSIIQQAQWGDPSIDNVNFTVPDDRVAMSLQVDVPQGVSGYLEPDDRIGVIGHLQAQANQSVRIGPDGNPIEDAPVDSGQVQSRYVATDVQVLTVGRRLFSTNSEDGTTDDRVEQTEQVLLTVAVTPDDAERLSFITQEGQMYFTLMPDNFEMPDTTGRNLDSVFEQ